MQPLDIRSSLGKGRTIMYRLRLMVWQHHEYCSHLGGSFGSVEPLLPADDELPLEADDLCRYPTASLVTVRVVPVNRSWLCRCGAARFCLRAAARSNAAGSKRAGPWCSALVSERSLSGRSVSSSSWITMATLAGAQYAADEPEAEAPTPANFRFLLASAERSCAHVLANLVMLLLVLPGSSEPPIEGEASPALLGTARSR